MMRLVLTLLAAVGFVWAALNGARAEGTPIPLAPSTPPSVTTPAADGAAPAAKKPMPDSATAAASADAPAPSTPAAAPPAPAAPRQYGTAHRDARVVITAKEDSWVRVTDADGAVMFMRTLKAGDSYRVPDRPGLLLDSGNAKGLEIDVDGAAAPALAGTVRRSVALDPAVLTGKAMAQAEPDAPAPAAPAAAAPIALAPADTTPPAPPKPAREDVAAPTAPAAPTEDKPAAAAVPAAPADDKKAAAADKTEPAVPAVAAASAAAAAPATAEPPSNPPKPSAPAAAPRPLAAATAAPAPSRAARPAPTPAVKAAVAPAAAVAAPRAAAPERESLTGAMPQAPTGVVSPTASRLAVEVNKGTVVRLRERASMVFVADPEIADIQVKSAGLIYVFGKRPGETVLYAADDRDRIILSTTVVVDHNVSRLRQALRAAAPNAAIDVTSIDGSLILAGAVASPAEAEAVRRIAARFVPDPTAIINQLQVVAPNQINLRVRVAEVSREVLKSFGINWESVAVSGNFIYGFGLGRDFINNSTSAFQRVDQLNTFVGGYRTGNTDINAAIDALSAEGLVTVLAEPNLTALSGETAAFLAGGEFPIPLVQEDDKLTIEFKTFGVSLGFTPHILDGNRINLRVRPEVSQLSQAGAVVLNNISIPALTTRRAETTVELGSGQSFVIAGLLQNNTSHDISRTPLLGDVPILGPLFRSDRFRRNETELVIIVTPYVVRPVSTRLALPTDGFIAPNDIERVLLGLNHRQQIPDGKRVPRLREGGGLVGPAGFILD